MIDTKALRIAIAVIWRDGCVLVARRRADATHAAGLCEFPGGKCDLNESFADCAVREVEEETSLKVLLGTPYDLIEWQYPERAVLIQPFDATILSGQARALESEEICWMRPDELQAEAFPAANASLIEVIKQRHMVARVEGED